MRKGGKLESWKVEKLGDVIQKTETINPLQTPNKEFIYIDVSSVNNKTLSIEETSLIKGKDAPSRARKLIKAGDVIFATVRPTLKRIAVIPEEYDHQVCSTGYFVLRGKEFINNKYLFYYLQTDSFNERMEKLQKGASYPAVTDTEVKEQIISYPPLPEQQRIVSVLDEAFASIAQAKSNAERNLVNARELFESVLEEIFSNPDKKWKRTTIGDEIELLVGFAFKSKGYTDSADGIRLLRGDNIIQGSLRWDGVKRWKSSEYSEYSSYALKEGDLVLAMDRPWVKAGLKYSMISKSDLPSLLVQRTACLRSGKNLDNPFLSYIIRSRNFIEHILGVQTGIGVPHISGGQIKDFEFSLPPLAEQRAIVGRLEALSAETGRLEEIYQQKVESLEELKKSVLGKAFAGNL